MSCVVVTGATGYLGSHACVALLNAGHVVIGIDDLSNSSPEVLNRVASLARPLDQFHQLDIRNTDELTRALHGNAVDLVFHFAGVKSVAESVVDPLRYHGINVAGSVSLAHAMAATGIERLIFSSSCTVYGEGGSPDAISCVSESTRTQPISPYGWSKLLAERVFADAAVAHGWRVCALRYFNPVGAHDSGCLGESPSGELHSLVPLATAVAAGHRDKLFVFGSDYDTPDGTCVRDYVHIDDVIDGHLKALDRIDDLGPFTAVNLGTGTGYSVQDVIACVRAITGSAVPIEHAPRRAGDAAGLFADAGLARDLLEWNAAHTLEDMVADHWRWITTNPTGYG
ncbi:MAG: UDP-glucose 4-epimerase GalE [Actinomycetota bacterium]